MYNTRIPPTRKSADQTLEYIGGMGGKLHRDRNIRQISPTKIDYSRVPSFCEPCDTDAGVNSTLLGNRIVEIGQLAKNLENMLFASNVRKIRWTNSGLSCYSRKKNTIHSLTI